MPRVVVVRIEPGIDVDEGLALAHAVGWHYTRAPFARTVSLADGQWTARDEGGAAVGMATCALWDERAWIGSMVVLPSAQRQGLGRALLRTAISFAKGRRARTLGLDATALGAPLYASEGFAPAWGESHIWTREGQGQEQAQGQGQGNEHAIYPVSSAEIMELLAYDKPRFGAGRGRYLAALMAEQPHRSFVAVSRKTGAFEGHGFADDRAIGPLMADTPDAARQLLRALEATGAPARAIVPGWNADAQRMFADAGYVRGRGCVRMTRGGPLAGRPETMYAIGAWALG